MMKVTETRPYLDHYFTSRSLKKKYYSSIIIFRFSAFVPFAQSLNIETRFPPPVAVETSEKNVACDRRNWIFRSVAASYAALTAIPTSSPASDELPIFVRRSSSAFVPLLEPSKTARSSPPVAKSRGMDLPDIASVLQSSLAPSPMAGFSDKDRKGYFVTGDVPSNIFRDDCTFVDPTNSVTGLEAYVRALRVLFDPSDDRTFVEIVDPLVVDEAARKIRGRIRSGGVLALPWRPVIRPYYSDIVYSIDDAGLIFEQKQTWSIGASEALLETLTPGDKVISGGGNQKRNKGQAAPPSNEPPAVTKLFDAVYGRKPGNYNPDESVEIDKLIDEIASKRYPWVDELLPGRWVLCYLRPGPNGEGIDRRLPFFPENLPFNESYQMFTFDREGGRVTNIGQLLGPFLRIEVSGGLARVLTPEDDGRSPRRFRAEINGGGLCVGKEKNEEKLTSKCLPLPIKGEGLFDGLYVGERLRIGRNINGGGAVVVQIRVG